MNDCDDNLQAWTAAWQHSEPVPPADAALARYVRRRSRLISYWMIGELIVAAVALTAIALIILRRPDPFERLAMGSLGLVCVGAVAFSWWNWRGTTAAVGETTAAYLELSASRLMRLRRALTAGWIILAAELVVFVPWVWYRQLTSSDAAGWWPWAFLAGMAGLGAHGLTLVARWARREAAMVERLRDECLGVGGERDAAQE
jgi:hypothetical protein